MRRRALLLALPLALAGCNTVSRLSEVGKPPELSPSADPTLDPSYRPMTMPMPAASTSVPEANALWRSGSRAFFKDQRAANVGDIVTVLVSMTDAANVQNNSDANRKSSETLGLPNLFGLERALPAGVLDSIIKAASANGNTGNGTIKRSELVTLRLAGVVTQMLPNGNLVVAARQQMRVNSELRELQVTGVIRPQDIASDNTVRHDRMAEARIAYGGRGQLTDLQTPRWGQQVLDIVLPF